MKIFFISLFVGLSIVLLVKDYPGYVLINYPPWVFETALPVFILILATAYFAVNYLVRIIGTFLFVRKKWGSWQKRRLGLRAQAALAYGLMNHWGGHWPKAEKLLTRSAQYSAYPALHLIASAHAAHQQTHFSRRDSYLELAKMHVMEKDVPLVDFTHAQLYADSGEADKAIPLLQDIVQMQPKNKHVALLLAQCLYKQQAWEQLSTQIKQMRKYRLIKKSDFNEMEVETIYQLLNREYMQHEHANVAQLWIHVPNHLRKHERLLPIYIKSMMAKGEKDQAEVILNKALKANWNDTFIELYGLTPGIKLNKQLHLVEQWISKHPHNPVLLHAAGRLCLVGRLWGKARNYLEASIGINPTQVCYKELGDLLELMGETQASIDCYRRGLKLAVNNSIVIDGEANDAIDDKNLRTIAHQDVGLEKEIKSLPESETNHLLVGSIKK